MFVERHRTQGGDMNQRVKRWLVGTIFIRFTGTPLSHKDKQMKQGRRAAALTKPTDRRG